MSVFPYRIRNVLELCFVLLLVVGVCLMVGLLFFLMIAAENAYDWFVGKIKKMAGTKSGGDPEDPASLVGSFKRYKN